MAALAVPVEAAPDPDDSDVELVAAIQLARASGAAEPIAARQGAAEMSKFLNSKPQQTF